MEMCFRPQVAQKPADNKAGGVNAANVQVVQENPLTLSIKTLPPVKGQAPTHVKGGGSAAENVPAPPKMKSNKMASKTNVRPKPSETVKPSGSKTPATPDTWLEELSSDSDGRSRSSSRKPST